MVVLRQMVSIEVEPRKYVEAASDSELQELIMLANKELDKRMAMNNVQLIIDN